MGIDPMTHQPRTDIFSSLPHLIALASLKELLENPSWEEQAIRLQNEAVQTARLTQYLQSIVQPGPPIPTFQNTSYNNIQNMSTSNLLNSLKSDTSILNHLNMPSPTTNFLQNTIPFNDHLPDLQAPCSMQTSPAGSSPWLPPNLSTSPSTTTVVPVTEANSVATNSGDACSSSSFGGAQMWSELLDDPFFHDIA